MPARHVLSPCVPGLISRPVRAENVLTPGLLLCNYFREHRILFGGKVAETTNGTRGSE